MRNVLYLTILIAFAKGRLSVPGAMKETVPRQLSVWDNQLWVWSWSRGREPGSGPSRTRGLTIESWCPIPGV